MSCKRHKKAIIEAAASGDTRRDADRLPTSIREHLGSCAHCRQFLADEQALSTVIELNLRRISSAEIPASLLSRLRIRLAEEPPKRRLIPAWSYALATASLLFIIVAGQYWHQSWKASSAEIAMHGGAPDSDPAALPQSNNAIPARPGVGTHRVQADVRRESRSREPEVLVQAGEEAQLIRFYEAMQGRPHVVPGVAAQESDASLKTLAIAPIEIARLEMNNLPQRGDVSR